MKVRVSILLSVLLHALVVRLLVWHQVPTPPPQEKIEITVRELPKGNPQSHGSKKSAHKSKGTRGKGKGGIALSKLRPSWSTVLEPGPNEGQLIDPDARGTSEWP